MAVKMAGQGNYRSVDEFIEGIPVPRQGTMSKKCSPAISSTKNYPLLTEMKLFWILYTGSFDDIDISGLYLVCLKKMMPGKTLFDDDSPDKGSPERPGEIFHDKIKETKPLERLKNLEEKIATVVERVKALKEEKSSLERKIRELEGLLNEKNQIIESLTAEKISIKTQG
jgi:hypothetical protein